MDSERPVTSKVAYPSRRKNGPCRCNLCRHHQRVKRIMRLGTKKELRALCDELSNALADTSADNNFHEANWDGSWPYAVENLTRALKRAKAIRKKRGDDGQ